MQMRADTASDAEDAAKNPAEGEAVDPVKALMESMKDEQAKKP